MTEGYKFGTQEAASFHFGQELQHFYSISFVTGI
jgi:hypothetical protein